VCLVYCLLLLQLSRFFLLNGFHFCHLWGIHKYVICTLFDLYFYIYAGIYNFKLFFLLFFLRSVVAALQFVSVCVTVCECVCLSFVAKVAVAFVAPVAVVVFVVNNAVVVAAAAFCCCCCCCSHCGCRRHLLMVSICKCRRN